MRRVRLPGPTGGYAVGTITYTVKDDREEVLAPGTMRSVAARVYYPVLKGSVAGLPKAALLSDHMIEGYKRSFKVSPAVAKDPDTNRSECYPGAEKIPGKKFPLIMFNPGYNSYREGNSLLCTDLASHGYVVISVAHSLEGMCTEFDDGSFLFFDKRLAKKMYEPAAGGLLAMYKLMKAQGSHEELARRFDEAQRKYCRFMMGRLPEWVKDTEAALAYAREHLADLIDFDPGVGAAGHSMGGNTAYALCAGNASFACGVNLDGALFGDYSGIVQTKPFMQVSCRDNEKIAARVYLRHTAPVYKVLFKDMKHMGFADAKHLIPMKSVTGRLDPDVMHANLCRYCLEFFDTYLKRIMETPDIRSSDAASVTVFPPDMAGG